MQKKSIEVGIIGTGAMGKGLFFQLLQTVGLKCAALADTHIQKAIECAEKHLIPYRLVDSLPSLQKAIEERVLAITENGQLLAECPGIEVLVESSSSILEAGVFCETALMYRKHLVMMNSEADLIFGPYFLKLAEQNGVVYTSCDGDQHTVLARLIDQIRFWGFDLVLAGNIKGYLDRYATPESIISEADKRNLDYKMATAYTDGTKLSIEMSLLANAYNLKPSTPGMHGPLAKRVEESLNLFRLQDIWESKEPVVDYLLQAEPGGGVFVIGHTEDPYQQSMLEYYKMGKGPFYLFYRPYHLCHIESMQCILEAVHQKKSLLQPNYGFCTNVYTYAKRDLSEGEVLDGLGGFLTYGMIETEKCASLPICLSKDLQLKRSIQKDGKIDLNDVIIDDSRKDFQLYRMNWVFDKEQNNLLLN